MRRVLLKPPFFEIGPKQYLYGDEILELARIADEASEKHNVQVIFTAPFPDICKNKEATVILVTENMDSPLARGADIVIKMFVSRETDRHNCQGTTSNTVLNTVFDALQAALIEETEFKLEQFALVHPGGAVGERLHEML